MLILSEDEQVYAKQLFEVRKLIAQLKIEETTQADRLLTILRGHQVKLAEAGEYTISQFIMGKTEHILVSKNEYLPTD